MLRRSGMVLVAAALLLMAFAASASAAIEAGDDCTANEGEGDYTMVALKRASAGLPLTSPIDGVVVGWKVKSNVEYDVVEHMRVLHPTGLPNEFLTVGESRDETITKGTNSFATRLPIRTGDRFGVHGSFLDIVFCSATGDSGDEVAYFPGANVGTTATYSTATNVRLPLVVTIEPDKDFDGYGDETQDKCPQSAATQGLCPLIAPFPLVTLDTLASPLKSSVAVMVATNAAAPVTVSGSVKLGAKPKGKARSSATLELAAGTQTVPAGTIASFTLRFPSILKTQLRALPPAKSLKLKVTATASNAAGQPSADVTTVKLKGQKQHRPKP